MRKNSKWPIAILIVADVVTAFLFLFVIGKDKDYIATVVMWVGLFASIATVAALIWAIFQYRKTIFDQERAYLNAIFDEIKININIRRGWFFKDEKDEGDKYSNLCQEFLKRFPGEAYPNPTDDKFEGGVKWRKFYTILGLDPDHPNNDTLPNRYHLPISNYAIKEALANGFVYRLLPSRIIINLGHLKYAIDRNNALLEEFNKLVEEKGVSKLVEEKDKIKGKDIKSVFLSEYLDWVHFRSYFIMMDMVTNPDLRRNDFVDKKEYDRIKDLCK